MEKMKGYIVEDKGGGQLELSPYGVDEVWLEVVNAENGAFFVLSAETAKDIANKLLEWAETAP